jgi:putative addiction module killer protein
MHEIEEYVAEDGTSPFAEWLEGLKDRRARMRLLAPLDRVSFGNLGDWAALSDAEGVAELRDHYRPAYRIYFSFVGRRVILLLAGSTKRDQKKAIKRASARLKECRERTGS